MIREEEVRTIRECIDQSRDGRAAAAMRQLKEHARSYRGYIGNEMRTGVGGPDDTGVYRVGGVGASVVEHDVQELRLLGIRLPDMPIDDLCDALAQANDNDGD